jgi:hypothetical protein
MSDLWVVARALAGRILSAARACGGEPVEAIVIAP